MRYTQYSVRLFEQSTRFCHWNIAISYPNTDTSSAPNYSPPDFYLCRCRNARVAPFSWIVLHFSQLYLMLGGDKILKTILILENMISTTSIQVTRIHFTLRFAFLKTVSHDHLTRSNCLVGKYCLSFHGIINNIGLRKKTVCYCMLLSVFSINNLVLVLNSPYYFPCISLDNSSVIFIIHQRIIAGHDFLYSHHLSTYKSAFGQGTLDDHGSSIKGSSSSSWPVFVTRTNRVSGVWCRL